MRFAPTKTAGTVTIILHSFIFHFISYLSSGMLLPVRSEPSEAIPSALMAI